MSRVLPRDSQFGQDCSGAEALGGLLRTAIDDIGIIELNEAFAAQSLGVIRSLNLDPDKVNVHGGACAQGHPVGSTGSRIIVTLINALEHYGKKRGVAALCIGGGEATAMAIELV